MSTNPNAMDAEMRRDLNRTAKFVKSALENGLDFVQGNCDSPTCDTTGLKVTDIENDPVVKKAFREFLEGILAMGEELTKKRSRLKTSEK